MESNVRDSWSQMLETPQSQMLETPQSQMLETPRNQMLETPRGQILATQRSKMLHRGVKLLQLGGLYSYSKRVLIH